MHYIELLLTEHTRSKWKCQWSHVSHQGGDNIIHLAARYGKMGLIQHMKEAGANLKRKNQVMLSRDH